MCSHPRARLRPGQLGPHLLSGLLFVCLLVYISGSLSLHSAKFFCWIVRLALPTKTLALRSLSALDFLGKQVSICERSGTLCGRSPNKIVNHHNLTSFRTFFWSNWGSLTHMTKLLWQGELCLWYKAFYLFLSLYFFIFSPWIDPVEIAKKYMCWSQQSWNALTVFLLHEIGGFIHYTQQKQVRIKTYLPILSA